MFIEHIVETARLTYKNGLQVFLEGNESILEGDSKLQLLKQQFLAIVKMEE
jgi:hypothetical protein